MTSSDIVHLENLISCRFVKCRSTSGSNNISLAPKSAARIHRLSGLLQSDHSCYIRSVSELQSKALCQLLGGIPSSTRPWNVAGSVGAKCANLFLEAIHCCSAMHQPLCLQGGLFSSSWQNGCGPYLPTPRDRFPWKLAEAVSQPLT